MDWNFEAEQTRLDSISIFGVRLKLGDALRLRPKRSADILDITLKGRIAVIEEIERDCDDRIHVAVVLEDDPGRDFGMLRQPGHRFFFSPEELEPIASNEA